MTVHERITWAKRLTIAHIVIVLLLLGFGSLVFLFSLTLGTGFLFADLLPNMHWLPFSGLAMIVAVSGVVLLIFMPLLTLVALSRAHHNFWGIIAYAALVIQILVGEFNLLAILPLIALFFLIDGQTFRYLTGSSAETSSATPVAPPT